MKSGATFFAFVFLALPSAAAPLDLSGEWRFALDPEDTGIRTQAADWKFPDTIRLPGVVNAQGFGEVPSIRTEWTGDGWRYPEMFKEWQTRISSFRSSSSRRTTTPARHGSNGRWKSRMTGKAANCFSRWSASNG